jgi:hypothetical protein
MQGTTEDTNVVQLKSAEAPEMDPDCPGEYGESCGDCCEPGCYANYVLRIADTVADQLDDCDCAPCQQIAALIDAIAGPIAENMEQLDEQLEALGEDEPDSEMETNGLCLIANAAQAENVLSHLAEIIRAIDRTYH